MPLIAYRDQRFNGKARKTVEQAKLIINDLREQGYTLTLRQLYYQFVSRNLIANSEKEYKRLGRIITDAREVGEIDWEAIEDRGRACTLHGHQDDPRDVLDGIEYAIRLNPWLEQDVYVETWVEKAALEGVLARPCKRFRAPYMACKGYLSASEAWRAGQRFERAIAMGKRPILLHLGDHDPSGLDMTRDNQDRLSMFARQGVEVRRLALNMDQVEQYAPPPNPAKLQDSRATDYVKAHGQSSWELDALSPKVIDDIVTDQLQSLIDQVRWDETLARETELRKSLVNLAPRWEELQELVNSPERPLGRLAALDQVTGLASETLDRVAQRVLAEGLYASAETRSAALEAVNGLATMTVASDTVKNAKDEVVLLANVQDAIINLRDIPPSESAVQTVKDAHQVREALDFANEKEDADLVEPEAEDEEYPFDAGEVDEFEQTLFGPEED